MLYRFLVSDMHMLNMVSCGLSTNLTFVQVYASVAFNECDMGQTEFTVPSVVSFHTLSSPVFRPPYTHQQLSEK